MNSLEEGTSAASEGDYNLVSLQVAPPPVTCQLGACREAAVIDGWTNTEVMIDSGAAEAVCGPSDFALFSTSTDGNRNGARC